MTTKDYIYLGVIFVVALAFYCNGFYAGVYRCKKMYEAALKDDLEKTDESPSDLEPKDLPGHNGKRHPPS